MAVHSVQLMVAKKAARMAGGSAVQKAGQMVDSWEKKMVGRSAVATVDPWGGAKAVLLAACLVRLTAEMSAAAKAA